jgi:hypothetical protein
MGCKKGKSALHLARSYGEKRRNFVGQHFWARGDGVSTVGHHEAAVRLYIQEQEKAAQRLDQLQLFGGESRFERFTIYKPPALLQVPDIVSYYVRRVLRRGRFQIQLSCCSLTNHGPVRHNSASRYCIISPRLRLFVLLDFQFAKCDEENIFRHEVSLLLCFPFHNDLGLRRAID